MFSIRDAVAKIDVDLAGLRTLALGAALSAGLLAGCQQQKRQPFADVDQSTRTQPTQQVASADAQAQPADAAAPAGASATTPQEQPAQPAPIAVTPAPVVVKPAPAVAEPQPIVVIPTPLVGEPRPQPTTFPATPHWVRVGEKHYLVRAWPQSTSYRPDGNTMAGPTYWPIVPGATRYDSWTYIFIEPAEFLANTVLLPFRAVATPPWAKIVYSPAGPPLDEHLTYGQPWATEQPTEEPAAIKE